MDYTRNPLNLTPRATTLKSAIPGRVYRLSTVALRSARPFLCLEVDPPQLAALDDGSVHNFPGDAQVVELRVSLNIDGEVSA